MNNKSSLIDSRQQEIEAVMSEVDSKVEWTTKTHLEISRTQEELMREDKNVQDILKQIEFYEKQRKEQGDYISTQLHTTQQVPLSLLFLHMI